ncbi:MAG: DUF4824 family protein, partial [Gallionella sp.]|nr:DUF4824 family protein [Gallionella sp.]
ESVLKLTQRELQPPYWGANLENSGMSLRLSWRVPSGDRSWNYSFSGGAPDWLDQAKMESLGFDASVVRGMEDNYRRTSRQLGKEVLLVLEMDGQAYQQVLQRTRQNAAVQDAKLAATPDVEELKRKAKQAQDELKREEQDNSRLFAVDAGLSQAALRAQYPDRNRYAIVRAQVRPWSSGAQGKIAGYIDSISIDAINVPYEHRAMFERRMAVAQPTARQGFEASVAFGQRLEPWLLGVSAGAK